MKSIVLISLILLSNSASANYKMYKDNDGNLILSNITAADAKNLNYKETEASKIMAKNRKDFDANEAKRILKPDAKIGMTKTDIVADTKWGAPDKVNKTTTANESLEQWVYKNGYLYFKDDKLVTIQTSK